MNNKIVPIVWSSLYSYVPKRHSSCFHVNRLKGSGIASIYTSSWTKWKSSKPKPLLPFPARCRRFFIFAHRLDTQLIHSIYRRANTTEVLLLVLLLVLLVLPVSGMGEGRGFTPLVMLQHSGIILCGGRGGKSCTQKHTHTLWSYIATLHKTHTQTPHETRFFNLLWSVYSGVMCLWMSFL